MRTAYRPVALNANCWHVGAAGSIALRPALTDKELEEENRRAMRESIVDVLVAEPQIAVVFLEQLGYTVIPPDEPE